jgi:hypothetical protein
LGFGIWDFGFGQEDNPNPKSEIPNPKSSDSHDVISTVDIDRLAGDRR